MISLCVDELERVETCPFHFAGVVFSKVSTKKSRARFFNLPIPIDCQSSIGSGIR